MESLPEEGRLSEQSIDGYTQNESQNTHNVPTGNEGYGLSDGGKLLTQVASRSNSGSKVASQPVENSATSATIGISSGGVPKLVRNDQLKISTLINV